MVATSAVILAAGKGTRMGSDLAKVLHPLAGRSLVAHVLDHCAGAGIEEVICVVGHQREAVAAEVMPWGAQCVVQDQQLGTGHAVMMAEAETHGDTVLVLCGDAPLVGAQLLKEVIAQHRSSGCAATAVAAHMDDPSGYGRMVVDEENGHLRAIVEQRDCNPQQAAITLINSGIFAFQRDRLFALLHELRPENAQGEYYLTDVVKMLVSSGQTVGMVIHPDPGALLGINTPEHLLAAEAYLQRTQGR